MSLQAVVKALELEGLEILEKFMTVVIASYAGPENTCFPSQETLSKNVGCHINSVARTLKALERKGVLERRRRYQDGYRTSDLITLTFLPTIDVGKRRTLPTKSRQLTHQKGHILPTIAMVEEPLRNQLLEHAREACRVETPSRASRDPEVGKMLKALAAEITERGYAQQLGRRRDVR